ncbi:MAG: hypothetical protein ABSD32_06975 [Mycobacterium sp.]|jgi:hypothetical protein
MLFSALWETALRVASTVLSDDVLDQIDEIVPPGTTLNPSESNSPAPQARARRR